METPWEDDIAQLLAELSDVQGELLELIDRKRRCLVAADLVALDDLQPREQSIVVRLQACHDRRSELLSRAGSQGLPAGSIRELAAALPSERGRPLRRQLLESGARWRLLQHQSLANWVLAQRSLVHLAQMLEIIATGGRSRPTYGNGMVSEDHGALIDQAA